MKLNVLYIIGASLVLATEAFVPLSAPRQSSSVHLEATRSEDHEKSRRDLMSTGAVTLFAIAIGSPAPSNAAGRPTYLTEPTEDFKMNEEKAAAFKRQQLQQKQKFVALLDKLTKEPDDEAALEQDLIGLRKLVIESEGLPLGIKKDEFYKIIRTRKAKGFWPTKVEIAYISLKNEVSFQQSPDSQDKAAGSFYQ